MEIIKNAKMKEYSNMKVGGTAKELIFIDDKNELKEILRTRNNIFLLGNGTNTLINDGNLDISFLSLKRLKKITVEEKIEKVYFNDALEKVIAEDIISKVKIPKKRIAMIW